MDAQGVRGAETVSDRIVRKLDRSEHILTKELYELVFAEDQGAFADYYYEEIASQNEIYAVAEGDKILSMLHLNYYDLMIGGMEKRIPYIVAVATHPDYRHQGMMKSLIEAAFTELLEKKVPFAYLMPANEAIYLPFAFRYISKINHYEMPVKEYLQAEKLTARPATYADVPDLCWFSSRHLKKEKGTFAKRTESYYERLLLEQQAQEGDIAVLTKDEMICGWFYTSLEEEIPEVREAVVEREWERLLFPTIADCFRYDEKVQLYAIPEGLMTETAGEKPLMMGRAADVKAYLELVIDQIAEGTAFTVTDPMILENCKSFQIQNGKVEEITKRQGIPVYPIEEIMLRFPLPGPVFLNELV